MSDVSYPFCDQRAHLNDCLDSSPLSAAYMRQWFWSAYVQIMACHIFGAKPLSKPMLAYWPLRTHFSEIWIEIQTFSFMKMNLKISPVKRGHFVQGEMMFDKMSGSYEWEDAVHLSEQPMIWKCPPWGFIVMQANFLGYQREDVCEMPS